MYNVDVWIDTNCIDVNGLHLVLQDLNFWWNEYSPVYDGR